MNADGVQPSALVLSWVARKTDSDLLATLARVERTASRIVRGALSRRSRKTGVAMNVDVMVAHRRARRLQRSSWRSVRRPVDGLPPKNDEEKTK